MITKKQMDGFARDGYLVIDLGLGSDMITDIIERTTAAYPRTVEGQLSNGTRLQDFWKECINVKELALFPGVLSFLEALYLRKPLPFQTLNFPVGTQQAMHADTLHFNSFPNNFMCGVWVALEDVDEDNGPVNYIPGSHLLPEYNMQDVKRGIGHENYQYYEEFIAGLIREKQLRESLATLTKGQAFIWHGNLLHGGSLHKDKSRTRHSQVTHYYFEGCSYYTPLKSTPDHIEYREPNWIDDEG